MPRKKIRQKYEFAVIATDIIIFTIKDNELQVLLIKMQKEPFKHCWAAPGGLVHPDESVDTAASRILADKTDVKNVYLEQLYTFGKIDRDPFGRVVSVAYFALIPHPKAALVTTREYGGIEWFPVHNLPKLAYDHEEIIEYAIKRLKSKLGYTTVVYSLLPKEFTLTDLQRVYEIILGKQLDKRNFRKKILSLNLLIKTHKKASGEAHRPAELYTFAKQTAEFVEIL